VIIKFYFTFILLFLLYFIIYHIYYSFVPVIMKNLGILVSYNF